MPVSTVALTQQETTGLTLDPRDFTQPSAPKANRVIQLLASQIKADQTNIASLSGQVQKLVKSGVVWSFVGTHAGRTTTIPTAQLKVGQFFYETDRHVLYELTAAGASPVWVYVAGVMYGLTGVLPSDLGGHDTGFLYGSTDYQHLYEWNGTNWTWGPGESGSGYIVANSGVSLPAGIWAACNGSNFTIATPTGDGTTSVVGTPSMGGNVFVLGGTPTAQLTATAAQWDPAAITDAESSHTHSVPAETTGAPSATTTVQSGAGATVASGSHTHNVPSGTSGAGSAHQHTLSNANAKLLPPSETNGGLPLRIVVAWVMRR